MKRRYVFGALAAGAVGTVDGTGKPITVKLEPIEAVLELDIDAIKAEVKAEVMADLRRGLRDGFAAAARRQRNDG